MTVHIRRAAPHESGLLIDLANSSKRIWGYDDAFIAATRDDLAVSTDHIQSNDCFVAERDGEVVGFYLLVDDSLERFFVAPAFLRRGIGRVMFENAVTRTQSQNLRIVRDPFAAAFYRRMGAVRSGEEPSSYIPGRKLPVYAYRAGD